MDNMIYSRLRLAKDLLATNGVIFVSLDDNESANLKKICDEVFGAVNFIGQITVVGNPRGRDYGGVARMHDYLFVYKKSPEAVINLIEDSENSFKMFDSLGGFELRELRNRNIKFNKENRPNLYYPFYINPATEDEHGLHEISLEPKDGWIELYQGKPSDHYFGRATENGRRCDAEGAEKLQSAVLTQLLSYPRQASQPRLCAGCAGRLQQAVGQENRGQGL